MQVHCAQHFAWHLCVLQVTSRYARAPTIPFGSSARFKANYLTF